MPQIYIQSNRHNILPELGRNLQKNTTCIRLVTVRIADPFLILTPHLCSLWYLYFKATIGAVAAGRRIPADAAGRFNCFGSFGAGMASGTTSSSLAAISLSESPALPPAVFFFFGVVLALDLALAFTAVDPDYVFAAAADFGGGSFFAGGFAESEDLLFGLSPFSPFGADLLFGLSPPFFSSRGCASGWTDTDWAKGARSSSDSWSSSPVGMMRLRDFGRWSYINLEITCEANHARRFDTTSSPSNAIKHHIKRLASSSSGSAKACKWDKENFSQR